MKPMQRKPAETKVDSIDDFIGGARAEKASGANHPKPAEGLETGTLKPSHKRLSQTSTFQANANVDIDSMIGRGSLFATNFKRETFYVHKDLAKAINKLAARGGKGEKTRIVNQALQLYLVTKEKEDGQ